MQTLDDATVATGSELTPQAVNDLKGSTPWMKFMAILGFIGAAFTLIGALMMLAAGSQVQGGAILAVLYIVFAGVYFYVSYLLLQWSNSLSGFVTSRSPSQLEAAAAKQKSFWMTVGVITIVGFVLVIIMLIAGVGFMAQRGF